jgi:hypothetical protein
MLSSTGVVAMKCGNLQPGMNLLMYLPDVVTCAVTFPLDEILEAVIPHETIQDLYTFCKWKCYNYNCFIFILAVNNSQRWGSGLLMTWNGVREHWGQLDNGEDWVETSELGWQGQVAGSMSNAGFDCE